MFGPVKSPGCPLTFREVWGIHRTGYNVVAVYRVGHPHAQQVHYSLGEFNQLAIEDDGESLIGEAEDGKPAIIVEVSRIAHRFEPSQASVDRSVGV